jgi:DNA-binding response OmpR family regulator
MLWREGLQRHEATRVEDALTTAAAARPQLIVIDRRLPRAQELITAIRKNAAVRSCSIVVLARGDFETAEIDLLEAGANAILRFPPGPEWDERLDRLLKVPARREARVAVQFGVEATHGEESANGNALNLSMHGMLLQTTAALSVGDSVTFSFRLPGAFVDGRGTIVRQAGANQYGIFFDALERDGREQIERYVTTL